jgi:hypothetical protein
VDGEGLDRLAAMSVAGFDRDAVLRAGLVIKRAGQHEISAVQGKHAACVGQ